MPSNHLDVVQAVWAQVNPPHTAEGAFEVTKRVAWALRGEGAGLLIKNSGENVVSWHGQHFSAGRICYPTGQLYKILTDVPATNGPSWQDNGMVDPSLYVLAIDPGDQPSPPSPAPPAPIPGPPPDAPPDLTPLKTAIAALEAAVRALSATLEAVLARLDRLEAEQSTSRAWGHTHLIHKR